MVGVAFQNLPHAENIGYIIPTPVVWHFLQEVARYGSYQVGMHAWAGQWHSPAVHGYSGWVWVPSTSWQYNPPPCVHRGCCFARRTPLCIPGCDPACRATAL